MYDELKPLIKSLKCNCFKIFPDKIIGTDSNMFPIPFMSIIFGDFSNYEMGMYYVDSKTNIYKYQSPFYSKEEYIYDSFILPSNKINSVILKTRDEDIECLENKKSSDGLCVTILDKQYLISLFKGFIPYTKKDECIANIYLDGYGYIIEFVLIKKEFTLNKFVRYIPVI